MNATLEHSAPLAPRSPQAGWDSDAATLRAALAEVVSHDRFLLWALTPQNPGADELLASDADSAPSLRRWLSSGWRTDELLNRVQEGGVADGPVAEAGLFQDFADGGVSLYCLLPDVGAARGRWFLAMSRSGLGFSAMERGLALQVVRRWRAEFESPAPGVSGRAVLGSDGRLLLADPGFESLLLRERMSGPQLLERLQSISEQRWPDDGAARRHDVVAPLGQRPHWIAFRRDAGALGDAGGTLWRLEVRQAEESGLPAVGELSDERIARSLGFIHDAFAASPDLETIARHAHVSPFHFHRLFSRQVGVSPKQYVLMKQLQEARWRLRSERTAICEIADDCGFGSQAHFAATFRKALGESPRDYRARMCENGVEMESA